MTHYLIENNDHSLAIEDVELSLMKHFLILGAKRGNLQCELQVVENWSHEGPGVWSEVDFQYLVLRKELIKHTEEIIRSIGERISTDYLNRYVIDVVNEWDNPQSTLQIINKLQEILKFFIVPKNA
ncbi:MAG: hypothetical protein GKR93_06930 [Gammaproteobacteria bacterium]|nr:hypothetical protein [Gammaproteobacteria bacterium]